MRRKEIRNVGKSEILHSQGPLKKSLSLNTAVPLQPRLNDTTGFLLATSHLVILLLSFADTLCVIIV